MLSAMVGYTIEDAFIKQLSYTLSIGQTLLLVGFFSCFFARLAINNGRNLFALNL